MTDELDLMHFEGEKHYYEVRTKREHIHLAWFGCGMIQEFTSPSFDRLKEEVSGKIGFEIRVARLELGGGCCRRCSSRRQGQEECEAIVATLLKH
jgi:Fur family transcriptional regulator, ferric uptake regulator